MKGRQRPTMRWYARPEGDNHQLRVAPRLESWNKAGDPDQVRLRAFLDDTEALLAASRIDGPWALRLDVGRPTGRDLLDRADLDNYAYPLASRLKDPGMVSVWCTKQHSEQSFVRIEAAREMPPPSTDVLVARTTASYEKTRLQGADPRRRRRRSRTAGRTRQARTRLRRRPRQELAEPVEADDRLTRPAPGA